MCLHKEGSTDQSASYLGLIWGCVIFFKHNSMLFFEVDFYSVGHNMHTQANACSKQRLTGN